MESFRQTFSFSAYQLLTWKGGKELCLASGQRSYWEAQNGAVDRASYFDLGSLTKVIATTQILAQLVSSGDIELSQPVSDFIPELKGSVGSLELRHLLSHSSGLLWWAPLYESKSIRSTEGVLCETGLIDWLRKNEASLLTCEAGSQCTYSDFNFLILGLIVERKLGLSFKDAWHSLVRAPLGLEKVKWANEGLGDNVVATEYRSQTQMPAHAQVFDENTLALGGISSHAGLFSSAEALAPFCRYWLEALCGRQPGLQKKVALEFSQKANIVPGSSWCLGWDGKSQAYSSLGEKFSMRSFGHLGFTGTSIWIDPDNDSFTILLTNRVHPSRLDERIKQIRPEVHNTVAAYWGIA